MNWDIIEGKWEQMKGELRTRWAKLTDDDLQLAAGKRDEFVGRIQERYGLMKDDAERQVNDWLKKLDTKRRPQERNVSR